MRECLWCHQPLHWVHPKGWVHPEGGVYLMCCKACGWEGALNPSPTACPRCGSPDLRDDHCAMPIRAEVPRASP